MLLIYIIFSEYCTQRKAPGHVKDVEKQEKENETETEKERCTYTNTVTTVGGNRQRKEKIGMQF